MKKQYSREELLMKSLLKQAGAEEPSKDFRQNIMLKIAARERVISPYKPLISKKAWIAISSILFLWIFGINILESNMDLSIPVTLDAPELFDFSNVKISQNLQYAIGFLALFLLQIPFLKRFLDKQYQL